jgi:hypothetical protein
MKARLSAVRLNELLGAALIKREILYVSLNGDINLLCGISPGNSVSHRDL